MSSEEFKLGYKRTDVGLIPADWAVKRLGELFEVTSSKRVFQSEWKSIGIPFYRARELATLGEAGSVDNELFITREMYEAFKQQHGIPKIGDMLVTGVGTLGKTYVVNDEREFYFKDGNIIWFKVNDSVSSRFLQQLYLTPIVVKQITDGSAGTTVGTYTISGAKKTIIPFPPRSEQDSIADALSAAESLLNKLDRLIEKKRDIKKASMQQLLTGQMRLPGFSGKWETKTIFDLAKRDKDLFDDGDWIESEHITNDGIRLIQTGNIGVGFFTEKETKKYINEKSFATLKCKQLQKGDLLICRLADPAGRACVLPDIGEEKIVTSVDVTIFRPPLTMANRTYLANLFSTPGWLKAVSDRSGGTTHKRISRGSLGRMSIALPPPDEQAAIANILSDMDKEIFDLENRRDKIASLKQGMMQELLTGRIRLI